MSTFKTIGLIGAMSEEVEQLLSQIESAQKRVVAGIEFTSGKIGAVSVTVCKSGVGKVNAAMCAQLLISQFAVDAVIMTGVAGALDARLDIGDLVISTECMQHDMDVTALGFPRGTIPFAEHSVFTANSELIALAEAAVAAEDEVFSLSGRVLSGDRFIADRDMVRELHEQMAGVCTEMEGAAVAQVCFLNDIPYVVIRSISDRADGSAHINFAEFTVLAADRSNRLVNRMLQQLS